MLKALRTLLSALLALSLLASYCLAASDGAAYSHSEKLSDELTYTNEIISASNGRVETFMLELKTGGALRLTTSSCDTVYGGMKLTDAAAYSESLGENVIAAVNTDFFSTLNHIPLGVVVEDGILKSSPEDENLFCVTEDGKITFAPPADLKMTLTNTTCPDKEPTAVTHLNKYRSDTGLYVYSSAFSTVSTRAPSEGWAVRFKILSGEMKIGSVLELEVSEKLPNITAAEIGEGYLVLTAANVSVYGAEFEKYAVGDLVTLELTSESEALSSASWASGGGDIILQDGEITDSSAWDKALLGANPRTSIGVKADGTAVLLVADGRRSSYSNGFTMQGLAEHMQKLGCVSAMNYDGGGSSTMGVRLPGNGGISVVNSPSDGSQRKCGAFAFIVCDTPSDGTVKRLFLKNDGAFILAGASTALEYTAYDAGMKPVSITGMVEVSAASGKVENGVYTAGDTAGADTLSLSLGSVFGTGTLYTVTKPESLSVKNTETGKTVTSLTLSRGESVSLTPVVKYLTRSVITDESSVAFSVSENIGSFNEYGVFTAGNKSNITGEITVTAGEKTLTIPVAIPAELEDIDGHWSEEYVRTLNKKGIVGGVSNTEFAPDNAIRRCDFLLMLYRASGKPAVTGECVFTDVPADAYYCSAAVWAQENGIAAGTGDGLLAPTAELTREQGFTFIYRYLLMTGKVTEETQGADISVFSDAQSVSEYAVRPVSVLAALKTVSGDGGCVTPQAIMTRGQMAKVLCLSI